MIAPPNQNSPATMEPASNNSSIIILHSSDGVNFRVPKHLLRSTSTVFEDMLTIPIPAEQPSLDGIPIVHMTEVSTTLELLLQLIHGAVKNVPVFQTFHNAEPLLCAIEKYDVVETIKEQALELVKQQFLEEDPISVYTVACRFGREKLAEAAAYESLKIKKLCIFGKGDPLVQGLEEEEIWRLRKYHMDCRHAVFHKVKPRWNPDPPCKRDPCPVGISLEDHIFLTKMYLEAFRQIARHPSIIQHHVLLECCVNVSSKLPRSCPRMPAFFEELRDSCIERMENIISEVSAHHNPFVILA